MKGIVFLVTAMLLTSGCLCCSTEVFKGGDEATTSTLTTNEQTTGTTLAETETTETTLSESETTQTTLAETETTETTLHQVANMADCLKKKNIESDEVIFLYTTSCCAVLERTVNQLGSYKFRKYELGISITTDEKNVLECLGLSISDVKNMQAAQFWCPASGEQMIVQQTEFIGAKDKIRDFAIRCRQKALEND